MISHKIVGIYLAAGLSTRMGTDKLKLPLGSMNLGSIALTAALRSDLDFVCVIANDNVPDWIDSTLYQEPFNRKWSVTLCHKALYGQAYSLRCGLAAAMAMKATAVMILLADQPFVSTKMINELLQCYQTHRMKSNIHFVASRYEHLARPPVVFDKQMYQELLQLQDDQGARHLIREGKSGICIDFLSPNLFLDVDTAEDYRTLLDQMEF